MRSPSPLLGIFVSVNYLAEVGRLPIESAHGATRQLSRYYDSASTEPQWPAFTWIVNMTMNSRGRSKFQYGRSISAVCTSSTDVLWTPSLTVGHPRVMKRTVVWITDEQAKALSALSKKSLAPVSALVRHAVTLFLRDQKKVRAFRKQRP